MASLIRQELVAGSSDSCRIAGKASFGYFKKQLQNFVSIGEFPLPAALCPKVPYARTGPHTAGNRQPGRTGHWLRTSPLAGRR